MTVAKTFLRRFWIGIMLVLGFMKLAVARIVSAPATSSASPAERPEIKTDRILRFAVPAGAVGGAAMHYGLAATGVFPYVKVVAIQQNSAPVPVEVAPAPQVSKPNQRRSAAKKHPRSLTRRLHSNQEKPFCYPANSQSCLNCPVCCIICGSCSSCAGCTGCTGCSSCAC
jgi:hypothetical protein